MYFIVNHINFKFAKPGTHCRLFDSEVAFSGDFYMASTINHVRIHINAKKTGIMK